MPQSSRLHDASHAFAGAAPWNWPEAARAFEMGFGALRAGFLSPAKEIFLALAPREPEHPELLLALAETELASG